MKCRKCGTSKFVIERRVHLGLYCKFCNAWQKWVKTSDIKEWLLNSLKEDYFLLHMILKPAKIQFNDDKQVEIIFCNMDSAGEDYLNKKKELIKKLISAHFYTNVEVIYIFKRCLIHN